ncbi:MAG: hypothetical protein LBI43_06760 [Streptococcaceae bacterium]|jgi:CHASE3 domain sensor protein|nr:hypothetical protein [Streptococcaceae bacterium]
MAQDLEEQRGKLLTKREELIKRRNKTNKELSEVNERLKRLEEDTFKASIKEMNVSFQEALELIRLQKQNQENNNQGEY